MVPMVGDPRGGPGRTCGRVTDAAPASRAGRAPAGGFAKAAPLRQWLPLLRGIADAENHPELMPAAPRNPSCPAHRHVPRPRDVPGRRIDMRVPQVSERMKEAPAHALRAVFAGIGQVLLVADRIKNRATDGDGTPPAAAPESPAAASATAPSGAAPS